MPWDTIQIYFLWNEEKKELAIELISGVSEYTIGFVSLIVNSLIAFFSVCISLIIGNCISIFLNNFIYSCLKISNGKFTITLDGILSLIIIIFINVTLFVILNVGLVFRNEIVQLIRSKNGSYIFKRKSDFFSEKIKMFSNKFFIFLVIVFLFIFV